jgi:hypothetical protein
VPPTPPTTPHRTLAARPVMPSQGSLSATLQGVAVAPHLARRGSIRPRTPHPAPFEWPAAPHSTDRTPPAPPTEQAIGSSPKLEGRADPQPLPRSHALLWLALAFAIACIAATMIALL